MNAAARLGLSALAASLAGVGVACGSASEAPNATTITGQVLDEAGAPIERARVTSTPPTQVVLTGADGRFQLEGVRFDLSYVVRAVADGFRESEMIVRPTGQRPTEVLLTLVGQLACSPGERRCTAGGVESVEVCNSSGNAFDVLTFCPAGQTCDERDGVCKSSFTLTVTPSAFGAVRSEPPGINCGVTCENDFEAGRTVVLRAIALARGRFLGWSGACEAQGTAPECTVTLDDDVEVGVSFEASAYPVTVRRVGNGRGRVTSMPMGIDCGSTCEFDFDRDATITLTAEADDTFVFQRWQDDCNSQGSSPTCTLTVDEDKDVRARFVVPTYSLEVNTVGTGLGRVRSQPSGINCGSDCQGNFRQQSDVTLSAESEEGSTFEGWQGGGCAGTGLQCVVTLDGDRTVEARFDGLTYALTVTKSGAGNGVVESTPAGIDCGSTCTGRFAPDTSVMLNVTPNANSGFAGWGGACAAAGSDPDCTLTVTEDVGAEAMFGPFYLFVLRADAACEVGLSFDGNSPLTHRCGMGPAATLSGAYRRIGARVARLDRAYVNDDVAQTGGLDTGRSMPMPPDATIELTVRRDGTALDGSGRAVLITDVNASGAQGGLRLLALDDGSVAIQAWQGGRPTATATAANALFEGVWAHLAATVSTSQGLELFVDGQRRASTSRAIAWTASSSTAWVGAQPFGVSGTRHRLNGAFDEVRLSRGVRY